MKKDDENTFDSIGGFRQRDVQVQRAGAGAILEEINEESTGIRAEDLPKARNIWDD